jgi:hypothetical protein
MACFGPRRSSATWLICTSSGSVGRLTDTVVAGFCSEAGVAYAWADSAVASAATTRTAVLRECGNRVIGTVPDRLASQLSHGFGRRQ